MSTTTPDPKTVATDAQPADLDERDIRALTEGMTTISTDAPGMYSVTTESGSEYTVDARGGSCTCPDARHRDVQCKHIRRARFAVGRRAIPAWVSGDAIDAQLGAHAEHGPVMTDGGALQRTRRDDYETVATDGGLLVYEPADGVGRTLVGFADVDDWDAIRAALARRGHDVGAIHHKPVFDAAEVGA